MYRLHDAVAPARGLVVDKVEDVDTSQLVARLLDLVQQDVPSNVEVRRRLPGRVPDVQRRGDDTLEETRQAPELRLDGGHVVVVRELAVENRHTQLLVGTATDEHSSSHVSSRAGPTSARNDPRSVGAASSGGGYVACSAGTKPTRSLRSSIFGSATARAVTAPFASRRSSSAGSAINAS